MNGTGDRVDGNGGDGAGQGGIGQAIADHGMSIALFCLFAACLAGQALSGWAACDGELRAGGFDQIGLGAFLETGRFLDGIFSNWQAAVLQLTVLVAFGSVLRQKGAAHSRKTEAEQRQESGEKQHEARDAGGRQTLQWKFGARPTLGGWLYANSMSLAFGGLFAATFALHLLFGAWKHNENQALRHLPPSPVWDYAGSSGFWSTLFECWEAEFGVIGVYIVASIFLRQENSPESKPVEAGHEQTGGSNE